MKKTFKKTIAALLVTATMAVGMGGTSASASTGDTRITDFIAPPSVSGTYSPLPVSKYGIRVKDNSSSVYLYITSSAYNLSVQTWGVSDASWDASQKANCTLNSKGRSTTAVTISPHYRYEIYNKIKKVDNGTYDYACAGLKFCSTSQYSSANVVGKWSPDYSYDPNARVAN